jgi:acyl-CoA hydrolase
MPAKQEPRKASDSRSELIRWMSIQDANSAGFVHGGVVMRMCDEAAGIAAIRHCGMRSVTAGMDRMTFTEPVWVGELLRCRATVNAVWRSSMEVGVRVEAENAVTGEVRHTSSTYLTMVAVDGEGTPQQVPPLIVEGMVEERRQREAETRRRNRLAEREEIVAHREREGQASEDPAKG